jgi:hypothetical protein
MNLLDLIYILLINKKQHTQVRFLLFFHFYGVLLQHSVGSVSGPWLISVTQNINFEHLWTYVYKEKYCSFQLYSDSSTKTHNHL